MAYLSADQIRAALAEVQARTNLAFLRYGLGRGWISVAIVEDLLLADEVADSTDELVVDVSVAMDEGRDAVLAVLDTAIGSSHADEKCAENAWWGVLIRDVLLSGEDTNTRLTRISVMWADFGYPAEWESFIYYMPQTDTLPHGPEEVLERARQCSHGWMAML